MSHNIKNSIISGIFVETGTLFNHNDITDKDLGDLDSLFSKVDRNIITYDMFTYKLCNKVNEIGKRIGFVQEDYEPSMFIDHKHSFFETFFSN